MTESIIRADSMDEVTSILSQEFADGVFEYNAQILYKGRTALLYIDIDPGGGFESGYESTSLKCRLEHDPGFKLAIHHETLIDGIGKFFGMQDIEIGYEEFDKQVVVKSDNEKKVKELFSDPKVRKLFAGLHRYNLHIGHHPLEGEEKKSAFLEFFIEEGVTDALRLTEIFSAFYSVLEVIDPIPS
jgi:hypothetical protein